MRKRLSHRLLSIALLLTHFSAQAEVINVTDHGVIPGQDATYALNQLVESLKGREDLTLLFPKGTYEFYPENAYEEWRAVSNHDNSLRRIALPIFNMKNLTIDGDGSTFMFEGRISPIIVESSSNITLKDLSIDWKRPFQTEMLVVENDSQENSFIVEIDPEKYPFQIKKGELLFNHYNWQDKVGANMAFNPKTRAPMFNTRAYALRPYDLKVKSAGKNRVKFTKATNETPPVGTVIASYGRHPTSRLAQAIHIENSKNTKLQNITVYAAGGMALIAERCEDIHLNHFVVTSTEDRMIATRADATHFIGCKGTITLEDCLLEHMLDDGINVHGAYVKVEEYLGNKAFICEISHFQQWGLTFAEAGDKIALLSRTTILPFFSTTVESVKILNEHRFVITLADVPSELPEGPLSIENLTWNPDLVMRNNIIRENRARSVLVTTKGKVLIEGNYFSSQMHGILIEGDNNKWYESGAVQDITITNNTFVNIGYSNDGRYPLYAAPLLRPEQHMGEGHYHRNINFTNNRLRSFNGHFVHATSVQGLNITGNTIELSDDYPTGSNLPTIDLVYCDKVTIENNSFIGFTEPATIDKSADTTNVTVQNNENFKSP